MQIKIRRSDDLYLLDFHAGKSSWKTVLKTFKRTIPSSMRRFDRELNLWCISRNAIVQLNKWVDKYPHADLFKEEIDDNWYLNQPPDSEVRRAVKILRNMQQKDNQNPVQIKAAAPRSLTALKAVRLVKAKILVVI
jgi:hypothetical protein